MPANLSEGYIDIMSCNINVTRQMRIMIGMFKNLFPLMCMLYNLDGWSLKSHSFIFRHSIMKHVQLVPKIDVWIS